MVRTYMTWAMCATALLAADSASTVDDREVAVMKVLREQVFPAEIQFRGGGYQDVDANKVGEYAFLAQLAGRAGTSKMPLGDRLNTGIHLLQGPLADGRTALGYTFAVVLPGGQQGLLVERDGLPPVDLEGASHRERFFAVLAWPTTPDGEARAFLLMPDGALMASDAHGSAPEPTQAISYEPKAGTWTTPWHRADPRSLFTDAKAKLAGGDVAQAFAQIDWLWRYAAVVDPSLFGVRASDMRDLYAKLAAQHPPAKQAYRAHMDHALEQALADTTDPSTAAAGTMPANHLAFLDYVFLAERVQTPKEIVASFKRLDAVNHKLATWEFESVAEFLVREGEFVFMSPFVPPFSPTAERSFEGALLQDYKLVRQGVMKPEHLMPAFIQKLALYQLVYQRNNRTIDALMLDTFVKMNLTDSEIKAMAEPVNESKKSEF